MRRQDTDPSQRKDTSPKRSKVRKYGRGALVAVWSAGLVGGIAGGEIGKRFSGEREAPSPDKIEITLIPSQDTEPAEDEIYDLGHRITLKGDGRGGMAMRNISGKPLKFDLHLPPEK